MDYLGGNGNGYRWFTAEDSALTNHPYYVLYSQQAFANIDVPQLKTTLADSVASGEAAPIVNYLWWVLQICKEIA